MFRFLMQCCPFLMCVGSLLFVDLAHSEGFLGGFRAGMTGIEGSQPGYQGDAYITDQRSEFWNPSARLELLNRFQKTETQVTLASEHRNLRKQTLRLESSLTPGAIIFPKWSLGVTGTSPVMAQPFEIVLGGKYSSYSNSDVWLMNVGFDGYAPHGWVFSTRGYFSQIKSPILPESRWVAGFFQRVAWYYADENYLSIYYSRNNDTSFEPSLVQYYSLLIHVVGARTQHWFNETWGLQTELQWQYREKTIFSHWLTGNLGVVFRF